MSPALVGGIAGGVAVLLIALLSPARACPECGTRLPKFRTPGNAKQAMLGGWTCPKCGLELDRKGNRRG